MITFMLIVNIVSFALYVCLSYVFIKKTKETDRAFAARLTAIEDREVTRVVQQLMSQFDVAAVAMECDCARCQAEKANRS